MRHDDLEKAAILYSSEDIETCKICSSLNIPLTTFYRFIRNKGIKKYIKDKNYLSDESKKIIDKMYLEDNISILKISQRLKTSPSKIKLYLKGQNKLKSLSDVRRLQGKPKPKIPLLEYKNIISRYEQGETYQEIAFDYGVSRTLIRNILKKHSQNFISQNVKKLNKFNQLKEDVLKRYRNKEKVKTIKEDLGLTSGKIDALLKNEVRKRVNTVERFCEEDIKDIINLSRDQNVKKKYIQEKYNIGNGTLNNFLLKNGIIKTRKTAFSSFSEKEKEDIVNMYHSECLIKEILIKYNLTYNSLDYYLKKNNIKLRENFGIHSLENSKKSSRGISGYYKGYYFRSLPELCFIGKVLMVKYKEGEWRSGENKNDKIEYLKPNGSRGFYYPDFIVKDKIVIECKPKHLHSCEINLCKTKAAINFCKKHKKRYLILAIKTDLTFIKNALKNEEIKMTEYELSRLKRQFKNMHNCSTP